mgnify:CR=1 FL=1
MVLCVVLLAWCFVSATSCCVVVCTALLAFGQALSVSTASVHLCSAGTAAFWALHGGSLLNFDSCAL